MFNTQNILKSETLSPIVSINPESNGARVITHYKEVTRFNNSWKVNVISQSSWQFILSLDKSWGFDPFMYSSIRITINSPSKATGPTTFDWLIFGFTSDNSEYISSLIPMENIEHNRIYPGCDTSSLPTMLHGTGDIASRPDFDRSCDVAGGLCANWHDMLPVNLNNDQLNGFPITFQFENDPRANTLRVSFYSNTYTRGFEQQCGFVSSPTNTGLKVYIGGNDPGQSFIIKSFRIDAWSQTDPPTKAPTQEPSISPTKQPTKQPTLNPSKSPTKQPTKSPTNAPSLAPSISPSAVPSTAPTKAPTSSPTPAPSSVPTSTPSDAPTSPPTPTPSSAPSSTPSIAPTSPPTTAPTLNPTFSPSSAPSDTPTLTPTSSPTLRPTGKPSYSPTNTPTNTPSAPPTNAPSYSPIISPTNAPTVPPTTAPTGSPTATPTDEPTTDPTVDPTIDPTVDPTIDPTSEPTSDPTPDPTGDPTNDPTIDPTSDPTRDPTADPTIDPTRDPTADPTIDPTGDPTADPTVDPTADPTMGPTNAPTFEPTHDPTMEPTTALPTMYTTERMHEEIAAVEGFNQFDRFILPLSASGGMLIVVAVVLRAIVSCYNNRNKNKDDVNALSFIEITEPHPKLKLDQVRSGSPLIDTYKITVHFGQYHFRYDITRDEMAENDYDWDDQTFNDLRKTIEKEFGLEFTAFGLYEKVDGNEVVIDDIDDIVAGFDSTYRVRGSLRSAAVDIYIKILDDETEGNTTTGHHRANHVVTAGNGVNLDESSSGMPLMGSDGVASHKVSSDSDDDVFNGIDNEDVIETRKGGSDDDIFSGIDNVDAIQTRKGDSDEDETSDDDYNGIDNEDDNVIATKSGTVVEEDSEDSEDSDDDSDSEDESLKAKPQQVSEFMYL